MPVDSSIALSGRQIQIENPMDVMAKAMTLKDLSMRNQMQQQEFNKTTALNDAYKNAMTIDANGNPTIDRQKYMSSLAGSNPGAIPGAVQGLRDQDLAKAKSESDMKKQLLSQVPTDPSIPMEQKQAAWDRVINIAKQNSLPGIEHLPPQYPGDSAVNSMNLSVLDYEKRIELGLKQQEAANKKQELDLQKFKTYGAQGPGGAPAGGKGKSNETDPSVLVSKLVPPDRQAKVFDEIKAAQNTAKNSADIMKAFDNAANNIHGADFVPGMSNADQKALHALMGPTFQDVEGTVRQAAMDNMNENTTPQFGDSAQTIATKRAALAGYLTSKSSAPTAKGYGIDLSKYKSTVPDIGDGGNKKFMYAKGKPGQPPMSFDQFMQNKTSVAKDE